MDQLKKLIIGILILQISSCTFQKQRGIEVTVHNKSNDLLVDVVISTSEYLDSIKIGTIISQETVNGFLITDQSKKDGSYNLSFKRNGMNREAWSSGYYTNGYPSNEHILIEIENDTTIIAFDPDS